MFCPGGGKGGVTRIRPVAVVEQLSSIELPSPTPEGQCRCLFRLDPERAPGDRG